MLTVLTAGLPRSHHQRDLCSPRSRKRIRSRSIPTNGFTFQLIAAASCIAIQRTARATFAHEAEYTRVIGQEADEAFAFWDYGPELSRRFRALKVWMLLKGVGLQALSEAIEKDLACARHFEKLVQNSEDFEMLAPVELSIFCFRHLPARLKRALADG